MATIDLDAARRAKNEVKGEKHSVKFGGKRFNLPPELPMEFAVALSESRVVDALRAAFNGRFDEFWAMGPTISDYTKLTEGIAELYFGQSVPNSQASDASS